MKRRLLHVFLLILVLVLLSFTPPGGESVFRVLGRFLWDSGRWFFSTIENTGYVIREWGEVIFLLRIMVAERVKLLEKAEELKTVKLNLERVREENKALLDLLRFKEQPSEIKTLGVRVIGQDTLPMSQTLVVDRGSRDGISEGSLLLYSCAVAGKVVRVNRDTSAVILIDSTDFTLGGIVESTGELGMVRGGLDKLFFEFLSISPKAVEGDIVVTAYDEGVGGLPLGRISHLESQGRITPVAKVQPLVNPQRTRFFLVVLPPGKN